ncbi:hypothetical protein [Flavobacterium sp.]|uniref:hypothetical protein n=1 Tax=Flavobacterium sp. TaxID=239 RepID=UPI002613F757|nr:hypothetical protein [Flavobacterium sp.]
MKCLKENWISWIVAISLVFPLIFNEEISTYSGNDFAKHFSLTCPFVVIILLIAFGEVLFGIHENLWDDFKKGKDIHIDKMMRNIKTIFILILISNIFWLLLIVFNLSKSIQINCIKSILLILTPTLIIFFISKEYYSLQKEYYN